LVVAIGTSPFYRPAAPPAHRYYPGVSEFDLEAAERRLGRIEEALDRLENGSYGRCASCGGPIDETALSVDPLRLTCERCASSELRP
jgi:RNA polymerase-binding transcription factor DksA